ncbi:MAG: hypothetical protein JWM43_168 [Acidobacteriaceae bacterium]|nr:hypothetical protein [Acidobacteriaceae bacterium]
MITGTLIAVALILGYVLTVLCSLAATFALTSASPKFVSRDFKITAGYKRVQTLIWLPCVTAGAFVTCAIAQTNHPLMAAALLAIVLMGVLWFNTQEAQQRGIAHQMLMSVVTLAGAAAGYSLAVFAFKIPGWL